MGKGCARGVQGCVQGVCRGVQGCAGVCRGVCRCVCKGCARGVQGRLPREYERVVEADCIVGEDVVVAQHDGAAQAVGAAGRRGEGAADTRDHLGEDRPAAADIGLEVEEVVCEGVA